MIVQESWTHLINRIFIRCFSPTTLHKIMHMDPRSHGHIFQRATLKAGSGLGTRLTFTNNKAGHGWVTYRFESTLNATDTASLVTCNRACRSWWNRRHIILDASTVLPWSTVTAYGWVMVTHAISFSFVIPNSTFVYNSETNGGVHNLNLYSLLQHSITASYIAHIQCMS